MLWQAVCHCHDEARLALWILWAYAAFFEGAFETLGFVPQQDGYSNAWGKLYSNMCQNYPTLSMLYALYLRIRNCVVQSIVFYEQFCWIVKRA